MAQVTELSFLAVFMAKRPAFVAKAGATLITTKLFRTSGRTMDFQTPGRDTLFKTPGRTVVFKTLGK